jgi:hypothetical protein
LEVHGGGAEVGEACHLADSHALGQILVGCGPSSRVPHPAKASAHQAGLGGEFTIALDGGLDGL